MAKNIKKSSMDNQYPAGIRTGYLPKAIQRRSPK